MSNLGLHNQLKLSASIRLVNTVMRLIWRCQATVKSRLTVYTNADICMRRPECIRISNLARIFFSPVRKQGLVVKNASFACLFSSSNLHILGTEPGKSTSYMIWNNVLWRSSPDDWGFLWGISYIYIFYKEQTKLSPFAYLSKVGTGFAFRQIMYMY